MNKEDKRVIADFIQSYAGLEEETDPENYNKLVRAQKRLCKEINIKYSIELKEIKI